MLVVTALVALQLWGVPSVFAQGVLFDDFSLPFIRGDRWRTDQPEAGSGTGLETLRLVSNGALLLTHRVGGGQTGDVGAHISAARLFFNAATGGALKFDVTVLSMTATGCSVPDSNFTDVEARMWTQLFQNGPLEAQASVGVVRISSGTEMRAVGGVSGIGSVDLGPVTAGTRITLRLSWDPANNRVDFQRNNEPVQSVTYTVDDSMPIASPFVLMEAVGFVANCTVAPRPSGVVSALFDNVFITP
jgi:hypothetical protein